MAVTVTCVDDDPVAVDDAATVAEDSGATAIDVLANDTDVDGGPKTIAVGDPAGQRHGGDHRRRHRRSPTSRRRLLQRRRPDRHLHLHAERRLDRDRRGHGHLRRRHPVAVDDSATVAEDSAPTAIDVLANDTDVDGGPKTIAVGDPAGQRHGGDHRRRHRRSPTSPNPNYCNGGRPTDDFTYTLNGGSTATVAVTVTCVDDPPVAVNDAATVAEDSGATAIDVLANDTDVDGGPKTIAVGDPAGQRHRRDHRRRHRRSPTRRTRTTATTAARPDTFTYTLNGGSTATVSVTVTCVDDPPVAVDDTATVAEDSGANAIDVLANDTDAGRRPDDDRVGHRSRPTARWSITGGGTDADLPAGPELLQRPAGHDADTFTYTLQRRLHRDGLGDGHLRRRHPGRGQRRRHGRTRTPAATAIDVLANDTDPDGGPMTIASVTQPANGTVVITGGGTGLTYQPDAELLQRPARHHARHLHLHAHTGGSTATVSVTVTCVDDPPSRSTTPRR